MLSEEQAMKHFVPGAALRPKLSELGILERSNQERQGSWSDLIKNADTSPAEINLTFTISQFVLPVDYFVFT